MFIVRHGEIAMTEDDKILRTQAWDFFKIVAAQRLTVINFYIGIATLLTGGQLALLQTRKYMSVAAGLGILLVVLSFVFGKWDKRSSDLIKLAERILKYYEGRMVIENESPDSCFARLFTHEHAFTEEKKRDNRWSFQHYFTYRTCLNTLFWLFSIIGFSVALICIAP